MYGIHPLPVRLSGAFSCHAQKICSCAGKTVLKNSLPVPFFFRGSHISHDFTRPKDICQYTAASDITITHLFAGKDKVAVCRQISF